MTPDPDPGDWEYEWDEELPGVDAMQVIVHEPQLLGVLYGPDGEVIRAMYDRPIIPFGFQPSASPPE